LKFAKKLRFSAQNMIDFYKLTTMSCKLLIARG